MKSHVYVGTFHKTGTVWMHKVFRKFAKQSDTFNLVNISQRVAHWQTEDELSALMQAGIDTAEAEGKKALFFQSHGKIPSKGFDDIRGFCVIRDPRDLILSATRYHVKSTEPWLHIPKAKFDGKTYAEAINAIDSFEDRVRFEMDNASGGGIRRMAGFARTDIVQLVRYEDLITDTEMTRFGALLTQLGFDAQEVKLGCRVFWKHSLFGGMKNKSSVHISNGAAEQWRSQFPQEVLPEFNDRFSKHLEILGYTS